MTSVTSCALYQLKAVEGREPPVATALSLKARILVNSRVTRSKRETQILAVVNSTVGMVGDLQGIAGKAMPETPSLDMPLLEASTDPEAKVIVIGEHRS